MINYRPVFTSLFRFLYNLFVICLDGDLVMMFLSQQKSIQKSYKLIPISVILFGQVTGK